MQSALAGYWNDRNTLDFLQMSSSSAKYSRNWDNGSKRLLNKKNKMVDLCYSMLQHGPRVSLAAVPMNFLTMQRPEHLITPNQR
jgi:hypothetical protein